MAQSSKKKDGNLFVKWLLMNLKELYNIKSHCWQVHCNVIKNASEKEQTVS
jgi:hypothetical protein